MALTTRSLMFSITELFELNFGILKLVSAIFLSNFYFSPNDSPNYLFHLKSSFRS